MKRQLSIGTVVFHIVDTIVHIFREKVVTNAVAFIIHGARIDHGGFVIFRQIHIRLPALNIGLLTLEVTLIMREAYRKSQFIIVESITVNTGDFRRYIIPFHYRRIMQRFGHKRVTLTWLL